MPAKAPCLEVAKAVLEQARIANLADLVREFPASEVASTCEEPLASSISPALPPKAIGKRTLLEIANALLADLELQQSVRFGTHKDGRLDLAPLATGSAARCTRFLRR